MKTALLFSGQPRFLSEAYPFIKKHILDVYSPDVYCHCWWSERDAETGMLGASTSGENKWYPHGPALTMVEPNVPELLRELYNPVNCLIEPSLIVPEENWSDNFYNRVKETFCPELNITRHKQYPGDVHLLSSYISIHKAYNSVNWNTKYDWIFVWRYDACPVVIPNLNVMDRGNLYSYSDQYQYFSGTTKYNIGAFIIDQNIRQLIDILPVYTHEIGKHEYLVHYMTEDFRSWHAESLDLGDRIKNLTKEEFHVHLLRNKYQLPRLYWESLGIVYE